MIEDLYWYIIDTIYMKYTNWRLKKWLKTRPRQTNVSKPNKTFLFFRYNSFLADASSPYVLKIEQNRSRFYMA